MKKFNFKLETPLKVKKITEKIHKQKLAEAILIKLKEEDRLNNLLQTDSKIKGELESSLSDSVKVMDLSLFNTYIDDLNSSIKSQKIVVDNAVAVYNHSRVSFIEIKKERQVFEKIKEKRFRDYLKQVNLEEQKNSDESAATRHIFREERT
ncbi:flagellar export protein FliJ [Biomaibacter acetigenes]|jgi:flagellar FliJ protein|uniref:Flagellar FliJ protein n=1 Tax=Biomaibacter acetigenes TaxID=2316383 RepID=A0A3G2R4U6_9FIRM|nr:flagellar export protein FliJ [Biomaibacter acetigenes]AYO30466.1 flagellar export protein FliJ [Biomaibacter acetigenes]RKL62922.1 flagellar export protein FliJ [Thermoanaerobacteraceae bacterium SP2]